MLKNDCDGHNNVIITCEYNLKFVLALKPINSMWWQSVEQSKKPKKIDETKNWIWFFYFQLNVVGPSHYLIFA